MTVVVPCSASHIPFTSGITFSTSKNRCLARYSYSRQSAKQSSTSHSFFATPPRTAIMFPQMKYACASNNLSRIQRISASAADVVVEEQDLHIVDEATSQPSVQSKSTNSISVAHTRAKQRQGRKSVMPRVKDEELVPGAIFTGKVITIHPFGAFVDISAFKDGLVHVSQLSDKFVKDVNDVISVGQEVKVRLLKVDSETGRIYLSMRDSDDNNKPRSITREGQNRMEVEKTLKFVKGQEVVGKVKKFGRSGVFISLHDGKEGFLPNSEEADEGFGTVMGNSLLEVGQEVKVRVLQVNRGSLTLTMKKKENAKMFESELEEGVVHKATNPFVIAFRRNKDIAAFLDERERMKSLEDVEETMEHDDP